VPIIDSWPADPILTGLPATAQLDRAFDSGPLVDSLNEVGSTDWSSINIVTGDGLGGRATSSDWKTIPLRSIGGSPARTDPGGPEIEEFRSTPWLDRMPAFAEVLAAIPGRLLSARVMALGPGAESPLHTDTKTGLPWGKARLHVPIITTPGAVLRVDDLEYCWEPGTLWYADFTRPHLVRNRSDRRRIHLVVDVVPSSALLALFPAEFHDPAVMAACLLEDENEEGVSLRDVFTEVSFLGPRSFTSFEESDGAHVAERDTTTYRVSVTADGTFLTGASDDRRFRLIRLSSDEFRFAGSTAERTIRIGTNGSIVSLTTRRGTQYEWSLRIPASPERRVMVNM